jgi:hypothetical protein
MKFLQPAILGVMAAGLTYAATLCRAVYAILLLFIALFLWIGFIVAILRAVKPE